MKRKLYVILISIIVFLVICVNKSYSVSEPINEVIAKWHSDFTTSESTDTKINEWKSELLEKLKSTFNYDGNLINQKMAMKTKIYITRRLDKNSKYKIRIRRERGKTNK